MGRLGCIPDTLDQRDHIFSVVNPVTAHLPPVFDVLSLLKGVHLPVDDQGDIGSCTAHGVGAALRFEHIVRTGKDLPLSRLQLYFSSRRLEGTVNSDAGAQIRDVVKVAAKVGVAPETLWPYDVAKFKRLPPKRVFEAAKADLAITYSRVAVGAAALKTALYAGHPVVIGISVYDSFEGDETAKTGLVKMPASNESMLGGHCMLATGWNDAQRTFTVRNSWGPDWGNHGYCHIPFDYLGSPALGADYWSIKAVNF